MFHSSLVSGFGILIVFLGTYVLALPELSRRWRHQFYRMTPHLRTVFLLREHVRDADRGVRFSTEDRTICYTFIDYIDQQDLEEPPEETPSKIAMDGAQITATFPDGSEESYCRGGDSQLHFMRSVGHALERRCRIMGISIAWVGTLIAIVGTVL